MQTETTIGNNQKMRKALIIVYDWILKAGNVHGYPDTEQKRRQLYDMMTKALSAPPRNCEVGDAYDQEKRFARWRKSEGCDSYPEIVLRWSQMPYEEGGAE